MFGLGSFFSRWPYTDLENLNLDWLIATCKEISDKFPGFEQELSEKLNAPEQAGAVGTFLVNIGNGKTKWESLSTHYAPIIYEAVNDWLDDHPEATTTVLDSSLELSKLTPYAEYKATEKQSGLLAPVYIGDYMTSGNMLPSSVCYANGYMYCVDSKQDEYALSEGDGIGYIRKYSISENELVGAYQVVVGHGNSLAYDGTYFYIAPIWEYTLGSKTNSNKVYKYTDNFILVSEIEAPYTIMGVSYDSITSSLYALDYSGNIYKLNNGVFEPYTTITNWSDYYSHENITGTTYYNQDIAVYNNNFYISSPNGNILRGMIKPTACIIDNFMQVARFDITGRWIFGELEGFEFTDGHLYTLLYTILPSDRLNAFVVELPVNHENCTSALTPGDFTVRDFSQSLSFTTRAKFSLASYEIRSMLQLFARRLTGITQAVEIADGNDITEDYEIYLPSTSIQLNLQGKYTCKRFVVSAGEFNIYCGANNKLTLTETNSLILLRRAGRFKLTGSANLLLSTPNIENAINNFINVGYSMPISLVRQIITSVEGATLYIGSTKYHDYDLFIGSTPLVYMPNSFTAHYTGGYVSRDSKTMRLIFHTPRAMRGIISVSGTFIIRGCKGYVDNVDTPRNLSDFSVTLLKPDDWTIEVMIDKPGDSTWTNIDNNTPVFGQCNFTFTWT